jgi:hypothetical protein
MEKNIFFCASNFQKIEIKTAEPNGVIFEESILINCFMVGKTERNHWFYLDKKTAIKFSKELKKQIALIKESEVNNG